MKSFMRVILFLAVTTSVKAQIQSPIVAEYQARRDNDVSVEGQILLRNEGLLPLTTTVEAFSFKKADGDGKQSFQSLDPNVSIHFDSSSARIPARQEHTFFYKLTCHVAPCWAIIFSTSFSGAKVKTTAQDSVVIGQRLPTVVYVYQKTPVKKDEISLIWEGNDLRIENKSDGCIRGANLEAHFANGRVQKSGAFPMFPKGYSGQMRVFKFPEKPAYVVIHFKKFTLDTREN